MKYYVAERREGRYIPIAGPFKDESQAEAEANARRAYVVSEEFLKRQDRSETKS